MSVSLAACLNAALFAQVRVRVTNCCSLVRYGLIPRVYRAGQQACWRWASALEHERDGTSAKSIATPTPVYRVPLGWMDQGGEPTWKGQPRPSTSTATRTAQSKYRPGMLSPSRHSIESMKSNSDCTLYSTTVLAVHRYSFSETNMGEVWTAIRAD